MSLKLVEYSSSDDDSNDINTQTNNNDINEADTSPKKDKTLNNDINNDNNNKRKYTETISNNNNNPINPPKKKRKLTKKFKLKKNIKINNDADFLSARKNIIDEIKSDKLAETNKKLIESYKKKKELIISDNNSLQNKLDKEKEKKEMKQYKSKIHKNYIRKYGNKVVIHQIGKGDHTKNQATNW